MSAEKAVTKIKSDTVDINDYMPVPIREEVAKADWLKNIFVDILDIDYDRREDISEEKLSILKRNLSRLVSGMHASVPILCGGEEMCPLADDCPILLAGLDPPVGNRCDIERVMLAVSIANYSDAYSITGDSSHIDKMYIQRLAQLDIYERRAQIRLTDPQYGSLIEDNVVGVDSNDEPIVSKEISKAWDLIERINNAKDRIHKILVGTPESKYRRAAALKEKETEDQSHHSAKSRSKFDEIMKRGSVKDPDKETE